MEFEVLTEEQVSGARFLDQDVMADVKKKVLALVAELQAMFNGKAPGAVSGVEFLPVDTPRSIATIKTAVGVGRLKLSWHVHDQELVAKVMVEREVFDNRDLPLWEPVYSFYMPQMGGFRLGTPQELIPEYFRRDTKTKYWSLGASIVCAIANGSTIPK